MNLAQIVYEELILNIYIFSGKYDVTLTVRDENGVVKNFITKVV